MYLNDKNATFIYIFRVVSTVVVIQFRKRKTKKNGSPFFYV
jgi:hypothetical protein